MTEKYKKTFKSHSLQLCLCSFITPISILPGMSYYKENSLHCSSSYIISLYSSQKNINTFFRGFSKYRLKNSFSKFALNHHDVLDIKYSMEEINEFIRSHFS